MSQNGPQHSLSYRQEVLAPLFDLIQIAESSVVIGASSMGKTRLIDFIMLPKIQQYYLKDNAERILFVRVDTNHIREWSDLYFFELLMNTIADSCGQQEESKLIQQELYNLYLKIMQDRNELQSQRYVELAVKNLCQGHNFILSFIFDEFDYAYQNLSRNILANLRGLRDANRNQISFTLFLRNLPDYLRPHSEIESFYELVSRNVIGLKPYSRTDLMEVIQEFEIQRRHPIESDFREWLYLVSGGHPGLIQKLFNILIEHSEEKENLVNRTWLINQQSVMDECQRLWDSVTEDEKAGLIQFVQKQAIPSQNALHLLNVKGLLKSNENNKVFSPIFETYIRGK